MSNDHKFRVPEYYEMRNVLAHGYFKVDLKIVWRTIENDLPNLEKQVRKIFGQYKENHGEF